VLQPKPWSVQWGNFVRLYPDKEISFLTVSAASSDFAVAGPGGGGGVADAGEEVVIAAVSGRPVRIVAAAIARFTALSFLGGSPRARVPLENHILVSTV
jgi:hypothetical protein